MTYCSGIQLERYEVKANACHALEEELEFQKAQYQHVVETLDDMKTRNASLQRIFNDTLNRTRYPTHTLSLVVLNSRYLGYTCLAFFVRPTTFRNLRTSFEEELLMSDKYWQQKFNDHSKESERQISILKVCPHEFLTMAGRLNH